MVGAVAHPKGEKLWREYKERGSREAREKLVLEFIPLVKYVAGRLAIGLPSHVELDDLISYGIFGLIEAIERYDPFRGVKFETYAVARIKGAILDGLRAWDWVPPSLRRKARQLERVFGALEQKLGRAASDDEVAQSMGIDVEELNKLIQSLGQANVLSLDDLWRSSDKVEQGAIGYELVGDTQAPDPSAVVEFEEKKKVLADAISRLPEKERLVVNLYYYEGLTAKEIAFVLGVSPSRISQLHSKAILRLRGRLGRLKDRLF